MRLDLIKKYFYPVFFGSIFGYVLAFAASVFVPQLFTEWAGSLVCPGRIEFLTFKQSYFCFTSATEFFDLKDSMFWAVFKRAIFPAIPLGIVGTALFIKFSEFLYRRREAAGF